jgi:hypothetical protein
MLVWVLLSRWLHYCDASTLLARLLLCCSVWRTHAVPDQYILSVSAARSFGHVSGRLVLRLHWLVDADIHVHAWILVWHWLVGSQSKSVRGWLFLSAGR